MIWEGQKEGDYIFYRYQDSISYKTIDKIGRINALSKGDNEVTIRDLNSNELFVVHDSEIFPISLNHDLLTHLGFEKIGPEGRNRYCLGNTVIEVVAFETNDRKTKYLGSYYFYDFLSPEFNPDTLDIEKFQKDFGILDVNNLKERMDRIGYRINLEELLKKYNGKIKLL